LAVRTLLELLPKASVALLSWAKFNKPRLLYSYEQRKKKKKGGGKEKKKKERNQAGHPSEGMIGKDGQKRSSSSPTLRHQTVLGLLLNASRILHQGPCVT
jgi:hypothetical protein